MRSISLKIILVLIIVSLIGALFTTFFIQIRTRDAFDTYVNTQEQLALAELLIAHYQENSSWENAERYFNEFYRGRFLGIPGSGPQGNNPKGPGNNQGPPPFVLTNPDGNVLISLVNLPGFTTSDQIPEKELKKGIALEIDQVVAGYLVSVPASPIRSPMQQTFLGTLQRGLIISTLVTLLIALVLGGVLITSFTRPIRKLVAGTEKIASGELGYQVEVNANDELGKLADSFNDMSNDLEKADQLRNQMTADIAHDLRTPLSILHGYTEAISEGKLAGTQEIFQAMHGQTRHLNYLIEDLRTLSLLDSKELNFQLQEIDPAGILEQTRTAFLPLAAKKDLTISLEKEEPLPRVKLDPDRLTQILGNLVSNAVNALPPDGKINIQAWQDDGELSIEVQDDGPGIPEADLPHIFNRHYKVDRSRGQEGGSSGLGLAITKKLVEAQGGKITVNSESGEGTAFRLTFPL